MRDRDETVIALQGCVMRVSELIANNGGGIEGVLEDICEQLEVDMEPMLSTIRSAADACLADVSLNLLSKNIEAAQAAMLALSITGLVVGVYLSTDVASES
jgi:hypothetical protein